MKERIVRIRVPEHLFIRYKVICAEKDLSIPKQTAELIRKFVEIQQETTQRMRETLGK